MKIPLKVFLQLCLGVVVNCMETSDDKENNAKEVKMIAELTKNISTSCSAFESLFFCLGFFFFLCVFVCYCVSFIFLESTASVLVNLFATTRGKLILTSDKNNNRNRSNCTWKIILYKICSSIGKAAERRLLFIIWICMTDLLEKLLVV